jgi:hypothetical protein
MKKTTTAPRKQQQKGSTATINESAATATVEQVMLSGGEDGSLRNYATKVLKFIDETVEKADELATEGEQLSQKNYLKNPSVEERKRMVLVMVGYLRTVRNTIGNVLKLRQLIG